MTKTAAPLGSRTVRIICQRLLQPTGRFRRRSLSLVVRRENMVTLEQLNRLIADQIQMIDRADRRNALKRLLVSPRQEIRDWDYGAPGERYPYWVVAESIESATILVYCEQGFGPRMPWGFLLTNDPDEVTLGMDAQWNWYLEEAFVRSGLWPHGLFAGDAILLPPEERFRITDTERPTSGSSQ